MRRRFNGKQEKHLRIITINYSITEDPFKGRKAYLLIILRGRDITIFAKD